MGSLKGRSMTALFYSCEVPSVLSISPSVSFADSSLIRGSLLYIAQILPNSILFKRNLKSLLQKNIPKIYNMHKLKICKIEYLYKLQFTIAISGNMIYN